MKPSHRYGILNMKNRKKIVKYCLSFFVIFMLGIVIDLACGPETDPYDYYVSFFHNNVQGQHNYGSFYLSFNYVFDENNPVSEADVNAKEWATYLGNGVSTTDVIKAMYQLRIQDDTLISSRKMTKAGLLPDSLKSNSFLNTLLIGNQKSALAYYRFAKGIESYASRAGNSWEPTPLDTPKLAESAAEALQRANTEDDQFIKLRYFYQAERLFHFSGNYKKAMAVYDDNISTIKSDSHIKGWALSLKAGEERRLHDTIQAAYLFSKVFAQYPERRFQAYKDYNFCSVKADLVVKLAKNNSEKAFIYAIDGFSNPELNLNNLQKVYAFDPYSEAVGVLLVREINKLEERYLTPKLNGKLTGNYSFYKEDKADAKALEALKHLQLLRTFCNKLADDNKYPESGLGYIASAYLTWMEGMQPDDGLNMLAKLAQAHLSPKLAGQKALVTLLLTAQKNQQLKPVNEAQLLPSLKWLDAKVAQELKQLKPIKSDDYFNGPFDKSKFAASSRDFYKLVLSEAYLKQGDSVKAALCILKSENTVTELKATTAISAEATKNENTVDYTSNTLPDFWLNYLHSGQIQQIIALKKTQPASPYIKFLASSLVFTSNDDLYDLLGTAYMREHNYAMAITAYKHIAPPKPGKKVIPYLNVGELSDPFISQLPDYPKIHLAGHSKAYDKLMFAQEMVSVQNKIKTDPKNAAMAYFRLATGLYNTSDYGNAGYLISYNWSAYDYARPHRYSYDNDYIKTQAAGSYYLKARDLSNNAEFKAKCTFMAAKCKQKQIPGREDVSFGFPDEAYKKAERNNPYFADLKNNYSKTAFFKEAIESCSYLRDFLNQKKK